MNQPAGIAQLLADNLRRLRETRDWSQQQLADNSGVPRPTIANLESGEGNPTLSVMLRLALALGCSIEQLISEGESGFQLFEGEALPRLAMGEGSACQLYLESAGTELLRLELPARGRCRLGECRGGFQRVIHCESGRIEVIGQRERMRLKSGDVLRLRSGAGVEVHNSGARASSLLVATLPQHNSR